MFDLVHSIFYDLATCADEIAVKTVNGLHQLSVPMLSRRVSCQFTLQPYAHTLGDFIKSILDEDPAIQQVQAENAGTHRKLPNRLLSTHSKVCFRWK